MIHPLAKAGPAPRVNLVLLRQVEGNIATILILLREALFPSVGTRKKVVRPSVRPSVLRKIIDFCEGDMEGVTPLLSTGSLNV